MQFSFFVDGYIIRFKKGVNSTNHLLSVSVKRQPTHGSTLKNQKSHFLTTKLQTIGQKKVTYTTEILK